MNQVFSEMDYQGRPPKGGIIITDGEIRFGYTDEYLDDASGKEHYSDKYPYEQEARRVQNSVINWWLKEYEKLTLSINLN